MLRLLVKRCLAGMGYGQYLLLALLTTAVLSGCGGGGGGGGVSLDAGASPPADGGGGGDAPVASEVVVDVGGSGSAARRVVVEDVAGRMATVLVDLAYYERQTVRVSDIREKFYITLQAVLPDAVILDINGDRVTLAGTVLLERDIEQEVSDRGEKIYITVASTVAVTSVVAVTNYVNVTQTVVVTNIVVVTSTAAVDPPADRPSVSVTSTVAVSPVDPPPSTVTSTVAVTPPDPPPSTVTSTVAVTPPVDPPPVSVTSTVAVTPPPDPTTVTSTVVITPDPPDPTTVTSTVVITPDPPDPPTVTSTVVIMPDPVTVTSTVAVTPPVMPPVSVTNVIDVAGTVFVTIYITTEITPVVGERITLNTDQDPESRLVRITMRPYPSPTVRYVRDRENSDYTVVTQTIYNNAAYPATLNLVNITGLVSVDIGGGGSRSGDSSSFVYSYRDGGKWRPLPADVQARLIAQGVYASAVTVNAVTVTQTIALKVSVWSDIIFLTLFVAGRTPPTEAVYTTDRGITVGYQQGSLAYVVLPPPNDSNGIDYEFNNECHYNWYHKWRCDYGHGLKNINAAAAWQRGYFGQGVTVAIVDSGVRTDHPALAGNLIPGKRFDRHGNMYDDVTDPHGHGTQVAGVIAADPYADGLPRYYDDDNIFFMSRAYGVAPSVSVMPLQAVNPAGGGLNGGQFAAMRYAADNNVQIINNSWGSSDIMVAGAYEGNTVVFYMPYVSAFLTHPAGDTVTSGRNNSDFRDIYTEIKNNVAGSDTVLVWAAGNSSWNSDTGRIRYCNSEIYSVSSSRFCQISPATTQTGAVYGYEEATTAELISSFVAISLSEYASPGFGAFSTLSIGANSVGDYALAPLFEESLLGNYVAVVATDEENRIAGFSNGCGDAKYWCIAAPGEGIYTTAPGVDPLGRESRYSLFDVADGTSFAAPYVSGGLAVLKSRFPYMPMPVVLAILFDTAEDLGEEGVDEVYGHGLMDLDHATRVQGSVNLVIPGGDVAVQDSSVLTVYADDSATVTVGYRDGSLAYVALPPPNESDGADYKTSEYSRQWGLESVKAAAAYQRGYFGQGVTVGVMDTGVLTTHADLVDNLVPGKRFDRDGNIHDDVNDADGHGTAVAGVIGAARNGSGMHGVAPSASIMPLQFGDKWSGRNSGDYIVAMRYAVANNVKIINNSWKEADIALAGTYQGATVVVEMPFVSALLAHPAGEDIAHKNNSYFRDKYTEIKNNVAGSDTVLVWGAGNNYWNSETGRVEYCDIKNKKDGYALLAQTCARADGSNGIETAATEEFISGFVSGAYTVGVYINGVIDATQIAFGAFSTLSIGANSGGDYAVAPLFEKDLLGHYAAVVAVDKNNRITDFSNGCGDMKDWCIAAPGIDIHTTYASEFYARVHEEGIEGTSAAAPHVSGGLAVLKSRFPYMPMPVVLAILFDTAEDLGEEGVDEVYGHGLMDLDHATSVQGRVDLAIPGGEVAGKLKVADSRSIVGAPFLGLAEQLGQVSVAVRYLGDRYYNMPLSGLIQPREQDALPPLGAAAADIMQAEGTHSAQAFGSLSFVQKASDGQFLRMAYQGDRLRLRYDLCADCESSVWEKHYLADSDDTAPYFAEDKQRVFGAANLTDSLEVFAAAGLGAEAEESTYTQWGIRWADAIGDDGTRWLLEYSNIDEDGSFLGSALQGGLATGDAQTQQGRLAADLPLAGGWRVLADYTVGRGEAAAVSGSMLAGVDYRYSGWNAALAADSLWRADDRMRIGLRRSGRLDGARATFRRGVLRGGEVQTVSDRIRWSDDAAVTALHWGYYSEILPDMELGLGYEYARGGDEDAHASSLQLHWRY